MKKILFITYYYLPKIGGIEQNIYKISGYLKDKYQIEILTVYQKKLSRVDNINGITINRKDYFSFFKHDYQIYNVIIIENFNIMPYFFVFIKLAYLRIFKKYKGKIIVVPHGGFTPNWQSFSIIKKMAKIVFNNMMGLIFINIFTDSVVAVSDWEKKELIKSGVKKNIIVIRNGIDEFNQTVVPKENFFIFIGRIEPIKNVEDIILTFKYLRNYVKFSTFKLKIIGKFQNNLTYYRQLKSLINFNKMENEVEFLGEKIGDEKMTILSKAKCLFCLSKFETDPVVVKEAFSVKTKVLISPNHGLSDFVREKNTYVKYDNKLDAKKLFEFINEEFSDNFIIPLYSWKTTAEKYEELF